MAFGYRYWMVYLPQFNRESFLLFVHNPAEQTKLRDYSGESVKVVGQPTAKATLGATDLGRTRFEIAPHDTTDFYYWHRTTCDHNSRHLSSSRSVLASVIADRNQVKCRPSSRKAIEGRALRGSRRQLQDYVNEHETELTRAIMEKLPPRLQELEAQFTWVCPIAVDNYIEYRDDDFLLALGLREYVSELASFWPSGGPSWDALAKIWDSAGRIRPGVLLVEAKSHIHEIYGDGCQASARSRELIESSLAQTKLWCGASTDADWTGSLYQSANRLAHLYFLRERLKRPTWLVNLYFVNDPIGSTDHEAWNLELEKIKGTLGLTSQLSFAIDVFCPALTADDNDHPASDSPGEPECSPHVREDFCGSEVRELSVLNKPSADFLDSATFSNWVNNWMLPACYEGPSVPELSQRTEQVLKLWHEPIPGSWQRGFDPQLMDRRYRRGDIDAPRNGEHKIEHDILCRYFDSVSCFGNGLLDGINALPLARDATGARHDNIEADMFLLAGLDGAHRLFLCEVKDASNNAWYAAIEVLRQLRLLMSSPESFGVLARRNPGLHLPPDLPVTALVLAPPSFYGSTGQKANAVGPAVNLLDVLRSKLGLDVRLAVWDSTAFKIKNWELAIE